MENAKLKINHTVVQGLESDIPKLKPGVVQGRVDVERKYEHTIIPTLT